MSGQEQLQQLATVAGVEGESLSAELVAAVRSDGATKAAAEHRELLDMFRRGMGDGCGHG